MSETKRPNSSRRDFLRNTGRVTAASALVGLTVPRVHAAEDNTLQVVLIGCGGRGTGAAANALACQHPPVTQGPVKLVAMADIFENRLTGSLNNLKNKYGDQVDVPAERQFIGFDGYQKAMDCLRPGDVAIFTTPLAFRWVHFTYAIQKGLNVFMEKPLTADGPTSRRMLKLGEEAAAKNLKVGVGLMSRHARPLQQLHERVNDGAIGDIISMRAYRMTGPIGSAFSKKWPGQPSELLWQLQRFHSFLWASGGCFNDFYIHVVDHCCWMKNAWPVKAQAVGGRHYRQDCVDQNFDSYGVEYTFADGAKLHLDGRCISGAENIYSSYAHGSKGSAIVSNRGDCGPPSKIFKGQNPDDADMTWESTTPQGQGSPHQNEWFDLVEAIRNDQPFNEVEYGVMASAVSSLGRMAAHTARELTLEDFLNSDHEYAPGVDKLTMDSPPPLESDEEGRYPIPMPGLVTKREY
jgi:predicted dehydrogenase